MMSLNHKHCFVVGCVLGLLGMMQYAVMPMIGYNYMKGGNTFQEVWVTQNDFNRPSVEFIQRDVPSKYQELIIKDQKFRFYLSKRLSQQFREKLNQPPRTGGWRTNISVLYGPATTPLNYLFLPSYKDGDFSTKVYWVSKHYGQEDYITSDFIYDSRQRIYNLAYACFALMAGSFYLAYRLRAKRRKQK